MPPPRTLDEAAAAGRLVIFAGAGISVAPPTCLPSWWEVNQAVVEALARQVAEDVGDETAARFAATVSERQRADRFPPEYQAEVIVRRVRHRYFEVLRCLDGDRPNASHLAIAALARAGRVRAILTTNFDRVLEAAFGALDTPLEVLYRPDHFEALAAAPELLDDPDAPCRLLKIHGSADAPDTLVDTLSQRKRGMPPATDACVRQLLRSGHWLFLGFSGADLAADPGYLHLRGDAGVARGFTWLVRTGKEPLAVVKDVEALYGDRARIVHGELPDWLDALARRLTEGDIPAPAPLTPGEVEALRAEASRSVLEHTDAWAADQGTRRSAVVLAALLEAVGAPHEAFDLLSAVRDRVAADDRATGTYGLICDALGSLHRSRGETVHALESFAEAERVFAALDATEQVAGVGSNTGLVLTELGRYDEALARFEAARAGAAARADREDEAVALHNIALVHRSRGDFAAAIRMFEEELEVVTADGDERARATVLLSIGDALARIDRHDEALDRLRDSLAIVERLGDEEGRGNALGNIATIHHARAEYDEALRVYAEAQQIFERLGIAGAVVNTLLNRASIAQDRGDLDGALVLANEATERAEAAGLAPMRARALHTAGALHRDRGALEDAQTCLEEALAMRTAAADRKGRADTLDQLGLLRRAQGDAARAREAFELALRLRAEAGEERERARTLNNLAMLAQDVGDPAEAARLLRESLAIHDRLGMHGAAAPAAFNLGNAYLAQQNLDGALEWFTIAQDLIERIGHAGRLLDARLAIAWVLGLQGRVGEAMQAFTAAEAMAREAPARRAVAQRLHALADVYRQNGHGDLALRLGAEAARIAHG